MNKKSALRNAIGDIQPNKPRIIPKNQTFTPPSLPIDEGKSEADPKCGELTQGDLPHLEEPSVIPPKVEQTQVLPTQVPATQVEETQVTQTQGKLPQVNEATSSEAYGFDVGSHLVDRKKRRREKMIEGAMLLGGPLAPEVQEMLVREHIAEGWGRLAHCVARQLRAPTRYGLKLVDVALILTIYDHTIAQVTPRMFAPITVDDFELDTGMDGSNIRAALRDLLKQGVLRKISHKTVNFWSLNHTYFERSGGYPTQGKTTRGKLPQGHAPCDNQGNQPLVGVGQTNPSYSASCGGNNSGIKSPQNLSQESKKESQSYEPTYPQDMKVRWENFEKSGKFGNSKKEREVFLELFVQHGKQFFDLCGRVVTFLESEGNGKPGEEGKIHSPMVWLSGHWEMNLLRYQKWIAKEQAMKEVLAGEALKAAQRAEKEKLIAEGKTKKEQEEREWQAKIEAATQRFLSLHPTQELVNTFAEKVIVQAGCPFTLNSWKKLGWESPVVKSFVITKFLKSEGGSKSSHASHEIVEAIA